MIPEAYENAPFLRRTIFGYKGDVCAWRHRFKPLPPRRFVIFAQGRTGSTLVTSSLHSHPEIHCEDEILRLPRLFPTGFIENFARGTGAGCFGFHVKCYQLTRWQRVKDLTACLRHWHERGWRIVYLWRQNLLEHAVSNMFAAAAGRYHYDEKAAARPESFPLDLTELQRRLRERRDFLAWEAQALADLPRLELNFERDLRDDDAKAATFARIQEFLGVTPQTLEIKLKKAVNKPVHELIANYDEVRRTLAGTDFEPYLSA